MSDYTYKKYLQRQQMKEINRIDVIIRDKEDLGFTVKKGFIDKLRISNNNANIPQMEKRLNDLQSIGKKDVNKNIKEFHYELDDKEYKLKVPRGKSVFRAGMKAIKELTSGNKELWDGKRVIRSDEQTEYDMNKLLNSMIILNPDQHYNDAIDYGKVGAVTVSNNLKTLYAKYVVMKYEGTIPTGFDEKVHDSLDDYNFDSEQEYVMESTVEKLYLALTGSTDGLDSGPIMQGEQFSTAGTPYE